MNRAWRVFGDRNGSAEEYTPEDENYVTVSRQAGDSYGDRVAAELERLLTGEQTEFTVAYPCHSADQERWFQLYATAVQFGDDPHYLLVHRRLDRAPPSGSDSASDVGGAPTRSDDDGNHCRLVTYSLSSDESAIEGILMAFDAIGIDPQSQDTTLRDWIDPDVIATLRTSTSDFDITFPAWNYPVGLTPEKVIIYTPERRSE